MLGYLNYEATPDHSVTFSHEAIGSYQGAYIVGGRDIRLTYRLLIALPMALVFIGMAIAVYY